ncbi:MAG: Cys/Met metabolism PLP-dependent enzyme, partial [Candidatus Parcubacteria bacterium]
MHVTLADLQEDLTDLLTMTQSCGGRVLRHASSLGRSKSDYREMTHALLLSSTERLAQSYDDIAVDLRAALDASRQWTEADIPRLTTLKRTTADVLRVLQSNLAFVLSAGDWQSPSFLHATVSQAGSQTGRIVGAMNDYKRDGHLDADAYEEAFRREYLRASAIFPPEAFLTSSGMAALSTLVFHLQADLHVAGPILAGASIYFENKIVLEKAFPGKVTYVDESDADAVIEVARRMRPQAVFLDSLCNTDTL